MMGHKSKELKYRNARVSLLEDIDSSESLLPHS